MTKMGIKKSLRKTVVYISQL